MSILQAQNLGIPLSDDPMETDAERRAVQVDDIDIDLEVPEQQYEDLEDEYMAEDFTANEHQETEDMQAENTYNDDEMVDGEIVEQDVVYEASIQDEDLQDAEETITTRLDGDDEIIDVENDESLPTPQITDTPQYEEVNTNETSEDQTQDNDRIQNGQGQYQQYLADDENISHIQGPTEPSSELETEHLTHQSTVHDSEISRTQDREHRSSPHPHTHGQQQHNPTELAAADEVSQGPLQSAGHAPGELKERSDHRPEEVDNNTRNIEAIDYNEKPTNKTEPPPASWETRPSDQSDPIDHDESSSKETTYTQAVVVVYQGAEISLFRSDDGDRDFILEDASLAGQSIADLLSACRPILGEDVMEQELVIRTDDLDLQIDEFASDASINTFSQLIEIYLQLQRNDGIENPSDFRVKLFTKPSLPHRLEVLRNAVEEKKGLSQLGSTGDYAGGEEHISADQSDRYEEGISHQDALVPTGLVSHEQHNEQQRNATFETRVADAPVVQIIVEGPVTQKQTLKADIQPTDEQAVNNIHDDPKANEPPSAKTNDRLNEQSHLKHAEATAVEPSARIEMQSQHVQGYALQAEQEDIIEYEDGPTGPAGPESSSGSSTLHGDVETTDPIAPPLAPNNAVEEETLSNSGSRSLTPDYPLKDLASNPLDANEGADGPYEASATIGNGDEERSLDGEKDKTLDDQDWDPNALGKGDCEDGNAIAEGHMANINNTRSANHQERNNHERPNGSDDSGSFEAFQGEARSHSSEKLPNEDVEAQNGEDFIEDTTFLDQSESHEHREYNEAQGPLNFTKIPTPITTEEPQAYEHEVSEDTDLQAPLRSVAEAEDNDEITYEDEAEDRQDQSTASTLEQDQSSKRASLKRSRGVPNADDTAAEGLQDAKRTRST